MLFYICFESRMEVWIRVNLHAAVGLAFASPGMLCVWSSDMLRKDAVGSLEQGR